MITIAAAGFYFFVLYEKPAVKAYRQYRTQSSHYEMENRFGGNLTAVSRYKLKIEQISFEEQTAYLTASEEITVEYNDVNVLKEQFFHRLHEAQLENNGGQWNVISDIIIDSMQKDPIPLGR